MMIEKSIIQAAHAVFSYANKIALTGITFQVAEGEFVGIIGPNGSGKTTLLKGILGLVPPVSGELHIFDCACEKMRCHHRAKIGYLPQKGMVNSHYPITAGEVALMGRYGAIGLFRSPSNADKAIVLESLAAVGMETLSDFPFGALSAGQQQRVLIARALSQRPKILLLDEPTTGIDTPAQHQLIELVCHLHQQYRLTILFVTHDINMVSPVVDSLILLKGRLFGKGAPSTLLTKEILSEVYGQEVVLTEREKTPYVIVSDMHHAE
ncbi:MAG: metal ABC transporter ATP-binding protein [Nitrospirae bacterium]|nr:metal ABC transporter ATP-binding protein [Candidatus Troglogloeales bacterium]MBI3599006.1 metal ABC transporter ATP-binding protein [Candidatus Troglogloeales bacterium]